MATDENKNIRLRIIVTACIFSLIFAVIGAKAFYIQVYRGQWLAKKASGQYETSFQTHGKRGKIFDRNMGTMAVSTDITSIAAHPPQIKDIRQTAKQIADSLNISRKKLIEKLSWKKKFVWIKRRVSPKKAGNVRNLKIKGIDFIPEHRRFYPNKTLAAQVLGFTDIDDNGIEGLEFYYNDFLKGSASRLTVLKDAFGRSFGFEEKTGSDYCGSNLILTLDRNIQFVAERTLKETVEKFDAKSGMAVVMIPQTGAVLAMAHYPFFNPNTFNKYNRKIWRNRIITDPFEPGSTMKIFSAAAALESEKVTSDSIFYCEQGAYTIGKNVVHDTHAYGWLSLQQIVKHSSNIGAVKVSESIGPKSLYEVLSGFGFGSKTLVDCPGETPGILTNYRQWGRLDVGTIAFGQGVSVSALQLVTAVSAIANKGILMKPYIVQAMVDNNGRLIENFGPKEVRRVISEKTATALVRILRTVITKGGTGVNAALNGYTVCGKTGTAQKINEYGEYTDDQYTASFIGFAPMERPEIAALVVIDEPHKEYYGGVVAAPAFKKIVQKTLDYMNIPPLKGSDKLIVFSDSEARG